MLYPFINIPPIQVDNLEYLIDQSIDLFLGNNLPYIQTAPGNLPVAMVQLADQSAHPLQSYRVYRRMPNPIPSYSNGAVVQNYDQQQQQPPQAIIQDQQIRRERQRRAMIEKIVTIFDEDGNFIWIFFIPIYLHPFR